MAKKAGEGKAARRAKDCINLILKGNENRAKKLAQKRKIKIAFGESKEEVQATCGGNWGFVMGLPEYETKVWAKLI